MRMVLWLGVGLAAGLVIAFSVQRALSPSQSPGDSPSEFVEDGAEADDDLPSTPRPRRAPALVITDVYTSDEAAQAALEERDAMNRVAEAILSSGPARPESSMDTSGAIAGLFAPDSADTRGQGTAPTSPEETLFDPVTAALEQEVTRVVEGFLRDAIEGRDVQAYLTALDEDFQYTFDGGTPNDPTDDVVFDGDEYREMAPAQLFEGYPIADVTLSPPYELELRGADVASVQYDYDMSLRGPEGSRELAGAASFLLMRGGTRGNTDAWRIVDWVDSPPRSREQRDER